jgi:thiol-disulfide isomerase/thioredoxin
MRRGPGLLAGALVVAALLAGCGRDGAGLIPVSPGPSDASAPATATGAELVGVTEIPVADREPMPALSGPTLSGGTYDLADDLGRVVVLNSWASWCAPCREEIPELRAVYDDTARAEVAVVGLNVNDATEAATAFGAETGIAWESVVDTDGSLLATIPGVPPRSLPSTVVIDRQGRVAVRIVGVVPPGALGPILDRVAAEPS